MKPKNYKPYVSVRKVIYLAALSYIVYNPKLYVYASNVKTRAG